MIRDDEVYDEGEPNRGDEWAHREHDAPAAQPQRSEPQEDLGRKIASDFVYAVHKWRGMSAGFMQAQVRRLAEPINAALAAERAKYQFKANLTQEIVIMRKELEGADKVITQLAQELAAGREKREPLGVWLSPADAINAAIDDARKPLVEALERLLNTSRQVDGSFPTEAHLNARRDAVKLLAQVKGNKKGAPFRVRP